MEQVITWVIIITGWIVVSWTNDNRESRKEERTETDRLIKYINDAVSLGIEFYTNDKYDSLKRERIFYSISLVESIILRISFLNDKIIDEFLDFKEALSLDKRFERSEFATVDGDSDVVIHIFRAAQNLINKIEQLYKKKYVIKPFYRA